MNSTQFIKTQYVWTSFKKQVLPYLTDKQYKGNVSTFVLPDHMNDSQLQDSQKSIPIPVEYFASAIQQFLETADKSKYYIGHIKIKEEVVAFNVFWFDDEWNFFASDFDGDNVWLEGFVFVSFATADTKTLNTGNSDTLTLRNFISDLEELINKYK